MINIDEEIKRFLNEKVNKGLYLIYVKNLKVLLSGAYCEGIYFINQYEAIKKKYSKITNNKNIRFYRSLTHE